MHRRLALIALVLLLLVGVVPAATAMSASAAPAVWQPPVHTEWQWMIGSALNTANAKQMGTGITAYNGATAPADNPVMYDIDAVENPASTVAKLHALGDHVVCYIEVGTAGNYYTAAEEGIPTTYYAQLSTAGVLSSKLKNYPENFVNINAPAAVSILESMITQQCANKGFDGVETDLDETFANNEGKTGFTITQADEVSFLTTLATFMHGEGLEFTAKNPDDTGSASFVSSLAAISDSVITEQCNQYKSCTLLAPYMKAGKAIFNAEYSGKTSAFCPYDNANNINGALFNQGLTGKRSPCQ